MVNDLAAKGGVKDFPTGGKVHRIRTLNNTTQQIHKIVKAMVGFDPEADPINWPP